MTAGAHDDAILARLASAGSDPVPPPIPPAGENILLDMIVSILDALAPEQGIYHDGDCVWCDTYVAHQRRHTDDCAWQAAQVALSLFGAR